MNCSASEGSGSPTSYGGFETLSLGNCLSFYSSLSFPLFFCCWAFVWLQFSFISVFPVALETTNQFLIADLSSLLKLAKVSYIHDIALTDLLI